MQDSLSTLIALAKYPDQWVTRAGGLLVTGALFALLLPVLLWALPEDLSKGYVAVLVITLLLLCFTAWSVYTSVYLRRGKGKRIGIAFDGFRTHVDDIPRSREHLESLAADDDIKGAFTIRMLPLAMVKREKKRERTFQKYRFDALLMIRIESNADERGATFTTVLNYKVNSRDRERLASAMSVQDHILAGSPIEAAQASEMFEYASDRFFDLILYAIFILELLDGRRTQAFKVAARLDERLESRGNGLWEPPRDAVRLLACNAILYEAVQITQNHERRQPVFAEASKVLHLAIDNGFAKQFPLIFHNEARNQFYLGNLDSAICLVSYDQLQMLNDRGKSFFYLARGALLFFDTQWINAVENFGLFLIAGYAKSFPWPEIFGFLDDAEALGHPGTDFLRALYTGLSSDEPIPEELLLRAKSWLFEDRSRECCRALLNQVSGERSASPKKGAKPKARRQDD